MLLDVPDVRQQADHDCGAAAVACLFGYYGVPRPRWVGPMCDRADGLQPDAVKSAILAGLGSNARAVSVPMTAGILRGFVADGKPVLCPVVLPGDSCGHWVVVRGVGKARVWFHCPTNGRRSLKLADWLACWRDDGGSPWQRWGVTGWV